MRVPGFKILIIITICLAVLGTYAAMDRTNIPDSKVDVKRDSYKDTVEIIGTPTGEDPWTEMEKIVNAYYSRSGIQYTGTMEVIDDNGDKEKVVETSLFNYTILNNSYHYKLAEMEVVGKKDLLLAVDHQNKTVAISRESASYNNAAFDIQKFKKILEEYKANALVTRLGSEKVITIDNIGDPSVQAYRIYYSPQTFRISKMMLGMVRAEPLESETGSSDQHSNGQEENADEYYYYIQVVFNTIKTLNLTERNFMPESKFISYDNGSLSLTKDYLHYRLLNSNEP